MTIEELLIKLKEDLSIDADYNDHHLMDKIHAACAIIERETFHAIFPRIIKARIEIRDELAFIRPIPTNGIIRIEGRVFQTDDDGSMIFKNTRRANYMAEWQVGFTNSEIPYDFVEAILKLAGWLFETQGAAITRDTVAVSMRGAGALAEPFKDSGAASILRSHMVSVY